MTVPRLRLFGLVAEAAGTRVDTIPGVSVDEVLAAARGRYGDEFALVAESCRVWVNGETSEPGVELEDADEVALIPPVSGG